MIFLELYKTGIDYNVIIRIRYIYIMHYNAYTYIHKTETLPKHVVSKTSFQG